MIIHVIRTRRFRLTAEEHCIQVGGDQEISVDEVGGRVWAPAGAQLDVADTLGNRLLCEGDVRIVTRTPAGASAPAGVVSGIPRGFVRDDDGQIKSIKALADADRQLEEDIEDETRGAAEGHGDDSEGADEEE